MGYSPWGCKESDMTERLHSLTLITSNFEKDLSADATDTGTVKNIL